MKKLGSLLLAIALILSLTASASAITLGASIRKYDDTFLTEMRNHMPASPPRLLKWPACGKPAAPILLLLRHILI